MDGVNDIYQRVPGQDPYRYSLPHTMSALLQKAKPAQTSPGLTRSASNAEGPGHCDEKWATGTRQRRQWTRDENKALLECYYSSNPNQRGYMNRLRDIWLLRYPQSMLTPKQLVAQCSNIHKRQLLSRLEIEEIQHVNATARGSQDDRSDEGVNIDFPP